MKISIVVPALNEARVIRATLEPLQALRARGHELILVDGGSRDETSRLAEPLVDRLLHTEAGRARQMNAGARAADGELLWFVHADTRIPADADDLLLRAVRTRPAGRAWGRFDVRLSGAHPLLRVVERSMNLRSRLSGIATGDQGLFVDAALFRESGGFPELPLMEDIEFSRRLKRYGRPLCLRQTLLTSSRRWEDQGVARTILRMWALRLGYFLGIPAQRLAAHYGP